MGHRAEAWAPTNPQAPSPPRSAAASSLQRTEVPHLKENSANPGKNEGLLQGSLSLHSHVTCLSPQFRHALRLHLRVTVDSCLLSSLPPLFTAFPCRSRVSYVRGEPSGDRNPPPTERCRSPVPESGHRTASQMPLVPQQCSDIFVIIELDEQAFTSYVNFKSHFKCIFHSSNTYTFC